MAEDWSGGWDVHEADHRAELNGLTPTARLEWLEAMLTLFADSGALAEDRAARARVAAAWKTQDEA